MSPELILCLLTGAAAGGFINGLAGFGTALLALGIWLQVMPPWQAVAIIAAMSVASGLQCLWLIRRDLSHGVHHLPRFLIPALIGLPLGTALLGYISASSLKLLVAAFMLLYGAFFAFRRSLPRLNRSLPLGNVIVGFTAGVLGGAASLSGVLPTMWCAMLPWSKNEISAVLRSFNVVILTIAVALFAARGYYTRETLILAACALPVTLVFSQIGIAVFQRLDNSQFRRLLIWLLFACGAVLMARELL